MQPKKIFLEKVKQNAKQNIICLLLFIVYCIKKNIILFLNKFAHTFYIQKIIHTTNTKV